MAVSCSVPKNFAREFYAAHSQELYSLVKTYKQLNNQKPFYISFRDKHFSEIEFAVIDDVQRAYYNFDVGNQNFIDTLIAHQYDTAGVISLVKKMAAVGCTWIANQDYYEKLEQKYLVVLTIRNRNLDRLFKGEHYCTYAVFDSPQPFDQKGRLLDKEDKTRNRELSGNILYKINNFVASTIAKQYR